MKLSKGIFLTEANKQENEISLVLSLRVNNEFNALFFTFSDSLDCKEFKRVAKSLNISQKALRETINKNL